jgi:hypothetical protein
VVGGPVVGGPVVGGGVVVGGHPGRHRGHYKVKHKR